jgi:hypothetical protein
LIVRVQVYRNLNKKCLSVVALGGARKGRVIGRSAKVTLSSCSLVVQPAGRAKVLRTKTKNVHAFVRGVPSACSLSRGVRLSYNPYKHATFVRADTLAPVAYADVVTISADGTILASNPR